MRYACPRCGQSEKFREVLSGCVVVRWVDGELNHVELVDWEPGKSVVSEYTCPGCGLRVQRGGLNVAQEGSGVPEELREAWRRAVAALLGVPVERVSVNEKCARSLLSRLARVASWLELPDLLCRAAWVSLDQGGGDSMLDVRWPGSPEYRLPRGAAAACEDLLALVRELAPPGG
ncbi:MAG: hypothetical protein QME87_09780 [Bacillota bacterium]|nr:hypothetical protein [Bacillota bacterium]